MQVLVCLCKCTGRAIALPVSSALAAALAASLGLANCYSFTLKFLCDGQGAAVCGQVLHQQSCCYARFRMCYFVHFDGKIRKIICKLSLLAFYIWITTTLLSFSGSSRVGNKNASPAPDIQLNGLRYSIYLVISWKFISPK